MAGTHWITTTIAQKPSTAAQPDMPESAIDSGCIDLILAPEDIAKEIVRIAATKVVSSQF